MLTVLLSLFIQSSIASVDAVVPERIVTPLLDIYYQGNAIGESNVSVRTLTIGKNGEFIQNTQTTQVERGFFDYLTEKSNAVFEVINGPNRASAVHIGHNLVLTNHHVLTDMGKLPETCGRFKVLEKGTGLYFPCGKVLFCNQEHDVCLVEMLSIIKKGRRGKTEVFLSQGPSLKLRTRVAHNDEEVLTAIGNTLGLGIHVSRGKGLRLFYPNIAFYAPTTTGNSGGALLNESGEMVGLVKSGTVLKISSDPVLAFNMALSSGKVAELAQEALAQDPERLEKFNSTLLD